MFDRRINIFTGHFGSGKTEIAVNYAIQMSKLHKKTAIVDLDIVNPYFRTADARQTLAGHGVKVILPVYANTNVDVPALPPEISMLFEEKEYRAVLDIGGDDLGAKAVSRYREEIEADDYSLYFVVNTRRPMTDSAEKIESMLREVEAGANIKVSGIVSNTNLLGATRPHDVLEGLALVEKVSKKTGIPVAFACGFRESLEGIGETAGGIPLFRMDKHIRLPWEG